MNDDVGWESCAVAQGRSLWCSESKVSTFVDRHTLPELEELYLYYSVSQQQTTIWSVCLCAQYVCDWMANSLC